MVNSSVVQIGFGVGGRLDIPDEHQPALLDQGESLDSMRCLGLTRGLYLHCFRTNKQCDSLVKTHKLTMQPKKGDHIYFEQFSI
jgi:hypothetical protein